MPPDFLRTVLCDSKTPAPKNDTLHDRIVPQYSNDQPSLRELPRGSNSKILHAVNASKGRRDKENNLRVKSREYDPHVAYEFLTNTALRQTVDIIDIEEMMGPFVGRCAASNAMAVFGAVNQEEAVFFRTMGVTSEGLPLGGHQALIRFQDVNFEPQFRHLTEGQVKFVIFCRWHTIGEESFEQQPIHRAADIEKSKREEARAKSEPRLSKLFPPGYGKENPKMNSQFKASAKISTSVSMFDMEHEFSPPGCYVGHWKESLESEEIAVFATQRLDGRIFFRCQCYTPSGYPVPMTRHSIIKFSEITRIEQLANLPEIEVKTYVKARLSRIKQETTETREDYVEGALKYVSPKGDTDTRLGGVKIGHLHSGGVICAIISGSNITYAVYEGDVAWRQDNLKGINLESLRPQSCSDDDIETYVFQNETHQHFVTNNQADIIFPTVTMRKDRKKERRRRKREREKGRKGEREKERKVEREKEKKGRKRTFLGNLANEVTESAD